MNRQFEIQNSTGIPRAWKAISYFFYRIFKAKYYLVRDEIGSGYSRFDGTSIPAIEERMFANLAQPQIPVRELTWVYFTHCATPIGFFIGSALVKALTKTHKGSEFNFSLEEIA